VLHFVAAVADADPDVGGGANHLAGPFVVEDMQGVVLWKGRFVDEGASELRFAFGEERFDEVLFDVQVLVEQFAQRLLVDVRPDPHEGEFEEAGHRLRKDIARFPLLLDVEKEGALREPVQRLFRVRRGHLPDRCRLLHGEGFDRQPGNQGRFLLREKDGQDLPQQRRRRRALGEKIQTLRQFGISRFQGVVRHGPCSGGGFIFTCSDGILSDTASCLNSFRCRRRLAPMGDLCGVESGIRAIRGSPRARFYDLNNRRIVV